MELVQWIACAAGAGAGLFGAWLSAVASARFGDGGFWRQLATVSRLLLSADDENELIREYLCLWPALAALVVRQLAVAVIGLLPIVLALAGLTLLNRSGEPPQAAAGWQFQFVVAVCTGVAAGMLVMKLRHARR